jgi:DNA-binding transcriptional MerR regulator
MLSEATKLLDLVVNQRPGMQAAVQYWRAVALTHGRDFDAAAEQLRSVLDDSKWEPSDPYRQSVLVPCWQLALMQHSEMRKRVGKPLLESEGRRLDAMAVVERHLRENPSDAAALELKQALYEGLSEADYQRQVEKLGGVPEGTFDHELCLQLGNSLLNDPARWRRGAEYLRLAARGMPARAPGLYAQIAAACERAGDLDGVRTNHRQVKQLVREVGVQNLSESDRREYFATLKRLGEQAMATGDIAEAIENLTLYSECNDSGVDTLRQLAELHEQRGDALSALLWNERAMMYDGKNRTLLERKDRYYYSVTPEQIRDHLEEVKKLFDVGYCLKKAKSLLDLKQGGPEQVDWALHLAELARAAMPESVMALTLAARARLRRGDPSEGAALLEEAHAAAKPSGFTNADEEDHWYIACRLLGDLYLNTLGRPDQALQCYTEYRKHPKAGVDTIFKMGQCYEALGDRAKASKCYQNVAAYDHPLASDAYSALQRLGSSAN